MRRFILFSLLSLLIINCKTEGKTDYANVKKDFEERMSQIEKIQYNLKKKSYHTNGGHDNNNGFVLIKKNSEDTIFGFSFYGIRNDINRSTIYKDEIAFNIFNNKNSFRQEDGSIHILGSPGGQMIYKDIFKLEESYKEVKLIDSDTSYIIKYTFDDLPDKYTNRMKTIELQKHTYLPIKVYTSLIPDFGEKTTSEYIFSDIKVNSEVKENISDYIADLNKFELIKEEYSKPNPLLNKVLPKIILTDLFDESKSYSIKKGKVTLIDFWEVWCGPCIASFPKVENLKTKFSEDLNVIGIVTKNIEKAKDLVIKKETTFLNLIGNNELLEKFNVNGFPRYYLIDKNGVILKEYFGFSENIGTDIAALINKN